MWLLRRGPLYFVDVIGVLVLLSLGRPTFGVDLLLGHSKPDKGFDHAWLSRSASLYEARFCAF